MRHFLDLLDWTSDEITLLLQEAARMKAAGFPVPPENRGFLGYTSEDMGNRAETGQFMSSLAPAGVAEFYRRELATKGWTERKQEATQDLITFSRGSEILSVAMQALDEKSGNTWNASVVLSIFKHSDTP